VWKSASRAGPAGDASLAGEHGLGLLAPCLCWASRHECFHDALLVSEKLGGLPLAGFNCTGEIGPVGGKNFLHGFTASIALLVDA